MIAASLTSARHGAMRERRALATLDTRLSRDIGIDTAEAAREAARPFWDALRGR